MKLIGIVRMGLGSLYQAPEAPAPDERKSKVSGLRS